MVVQAPTLSTVWLPTATSAVPSIYIKPGNEAYAKLVAEDAFANAKDGDDSFSPPDPLKIIPQTARIIPAKSQIAKGSAPLIISEIPSVVQLPTKQQRLRILFETAREARKTQHLAEAKGSYDEALRELEGFVDGTDNDAPLHMQLPGGYHLYTEALFQTSVLSRPEIAPINISRLSRFLDSPPLGPDTPVADMARAKILIAFNLMQHTASTFERQDFLFQKAMDQLDCLMEVVKEEAQDKFRAAALKAHDMMRAGVEQRSLKASIERKAMSKIEKAVVEIDSIHKAHADAVHDTDLMTNYLSDLKTIRTLLFLARSAAAPQRSLYRRALELADEARGMLAPESGAEHADLDLYARLLGLELVSGQLTLAVGCRATQSQRELVKDLRKRFQEVTHIHSSEEGHSDEGALKSRHTAEEKNKIIASYQADAAMLMAYLGLWNDALFRARTATTGPFARTPAAKKLLRSEIFSSFVDGYRILSEDKIKELSKKGSWRKEFEVIVANAHSRRILYTLGAGAVGMGLGALWGLYADVPPVFPGMAGAFLGSLAYRIFEASRSEEYTYRELTDKLDRSLKENAANVGRLLVHSAIDMIPWIMPAYMANPDEMGTYILYRVFDSAIDGIGTAFDWTASHAAPLFNPDTYSSALNTLNTAPMPSYEQIVNTAIEVLGASALGLGAANIMWRDALPWTKKWGALFIPGLIAMLANHAFPPEAWGMMIDNLSSGNLKQTLEILWNGTLNMADEMKTILTWGAATTFVSTFPHFKGHKQKEHINTMSIMFLPAAAILSADIGYYLAPHADSYLWRVLRAGILLFESYFLMNVTGMVDWERKPRGNWRENTENFIRANMTANPALTMTMIMTNAVTAPLGGYYERNKDLVDPMLIALQGIAITYCLVPITLFASGLIKRKIPYLERAMEGWDDARQAGYGPLRATGAAVMGLGSALNTPYISNRFMRPFMWDVIPAGLRTWLVWDSAAGQLAMSGFNTVSGNPISTRMWPETGGTKWEREAIVKRFREAGAEIEKKNRQVIEGNLTANQAAYAIRDVMSNLRNYFLKAGRVIDDKHIIMPQESIKDRLLPFYSIKMAMEPPSFPQRANPHFYANLFKMLYSDRSKERAGSEDEILSDDDVRLLLSYAKTEAADPSAYNVLLPLVKTLALARHSRDATIRYEINKFFDDNPEIPIMLNIDLDGETLKPLDEVYRRVAKRKVRREVRSSISDEVSGYRRQKKANIPLRYAFMTEVKTATVSIAPPSPKGSQSSSDDEESDEDKINIILGR